MAILTKDTQERVIRLLVEEGLVGAEVAKEVQTEATKVHKSLFEVLRGKGVSNSTIVHATAVVMGMGYVDLENVKMDQDTLLALPKDVAEKSMAVAIGEQSGILVVAMLDATNVQATDYLATLTQKPVRAVMASEESIRSALIQYTGDFSNVTQAVKETNQEAQQQQATEDVKTLTQDSPISKALTTILEYAVKSKASDIHIEPLETSLIIRMRIDGVLRQVMDLPKAIEPALVSRIKIMSNLKIDEHRIPQDGQFTVAVADKEVDLRIAIAPVVWGEQVVIRLLDKTGTTLDVEDMGMMGHALRMVNTGIEKPNGMILTSGPTGSGKSTTLYALIKKIKSEKINIVTLEDPVEYKMDGINQIQINADVGLTFASGLRSVLRQDPDVVMVGEIRDEETASLAVQAALTGHLVLSTLHTNSAAGILPRFIEMGIEPFLLASTLNTVIGQRLVRRVAAKREAYQSSEIQTQELTEVVGDLLPESAEKVAEVSADLGYGTLPVRGQKSYTLVKGIEERDTPGGYKGRMGLYETIEIDEDIQKLIVSRATSNDIMKVAKEKGTVTMRQDGMMKALAGITTMDEVNRVASDIA